MQMSCFPVFQRCRIFSQEQRAALCAALCNVPATLQNYLIKALPDNNVASPAVRRACQPVSRIAVNKPKCMYMLRDRLLSEQQETGGTDLLSISLTLLCL